LDRGVRESGCLLDSNRFPALVQHHLDLYVIDEEGLFEIGAILRFGGMNQNRWNHRVAVPMKQQSQAKREKTDR
jgi:hypothetical protein